MTYDFVIIGSGFGGSVSAMRLSEKGYSVLVLERGKRFRDEDFAKTSWDLPRYLWSPKLRCFGILEISAFRDVVVLHGSGVGGGSLGYANVLMEPDDYSSPAWTHLQDWRAALTPHFATARRMLGVTSNPRSWPADDVLRGIAEELGTADSFKPTPTGVYFGESEEEEVADPYFGGEGPARRGCNHCGACMVGCRHGAKNTLVKNYLWFAERWGAEVKAETEVRDIRPLPVQRDGARFEIVTRSSTAHVFARPETILRARNVVVSAGALGTMRLLFRCRDVTGSLPKLSPRLGDVVRTNSESILGSVARSDDVDYSRGIAITSIFNADAVTTIEPVRYPPGSSTMRYLGGALLSGGGFPTRLGRSLLDIVRRPLDFLRTHVLPGWAERSTVILVMQSVDNRIRMRLRRRATSLFRRRLQSELEPGQTIKSSIPLGHEVTRRFAERTNGIPLGSINESLFDIPLTAHILGGAPFGLDASEGVVGLDCQVHNYPGLYVVDGSIMPANPGVNPSLTITALAEYAMTHIAPAPGSASRAVSKVAERTEGR